MRFGKGEPEGVVAPETANNAATGAAMIPLLALGLPGGALTAIMIGVFNLHDMDIGPLIMIEGIVHLLRIPFPILAPAILIFSTIGAYALRANILDVYTMFGAGIAGFFMRRGDYSIPAVVMGVILGQSGENVFAQALVMIDYDFLNFFTQPISGVLIAGGLATIAYNIFKHSRMYFSTYGLLDETTSRESGD